MNQINRFEDLLVWQHARELVKMVYKSSALWRDLSLKDQIRRASVSVMSNIAEGFERGTKNEYLAFLYIAKGSVGEVRSQSYAALDVGYISNENFAQIKAKCEFISRMLAKLIASYKIHSYGGQRHGNSSVAKEKAFDEWIRVIRETGKIG